MAKIKSILNEILTLCGYTMFSILAIIGLIVYFWSMFPSHLYPALVNNVN